MQCSAPRLRRGALLIRDPKAAVGPGSAEQRCTLHRVRDTEYRLEEASVCQRILFHCPFPQFLRIDVDNERRQQDQAADQYFQKALAGSLRCNETFDITEQFPPRRIDFVRPVRSDDVAQRLRDDAEERDEQFARRAVGVVRGNL